ncbi:facilitated trehalose transporter Tret1-like isoform X2 [Epargyreus clarus]|uniref:facilitated trehalose transporter Tret1-like isoform X2 n=1 Tax=Epargyreus clarus TaxID=520877 RepID=UPI003C2E6BB4
MQYVLMLIISSGIWTMFFMCGLCTGSPTVFIPQIRREANSSDVISKEMISWLSCAHTYSGACFVPILATLTGLIGRKYSNLFIGIISLIGFIVFSCSTNATHLLISEIIQGSIVAALVTSAILIVTEYTSPSYRGLFLTIKSASFFWGLWVANTIGTFTHWKYIGILGGSCAIYTTLVSLYMPESPYWLANKERFNDCTSSLYWIRGSNDESKRELLNLLKARSNAETDTRSFLSKIVEFKHAILSKTFYKPLLLSMLIITLNNFSGKYGFSVFAIDIIKNITNSESAAYSGMLILDGFTVFSTYVGSGLSKVIKRRTLFVASTLVAVLFLFIISIYLYLKSITVIVENKYVSIILLIGYSVALAVGPLILSTSLTAELIPVTHRTSFTLLMGIFTNLVFGTLIKVAPLLFGLLGDHGAFLFYGVSMTVCLIPIYAYLPETKDKTLMEIEECLKGTLALNETKSMNKI